MQAYMLVCMTCVFARSFSNRNTTAPIGNMQVSAAPRLIYIHCFVRKQGNHSLFCEEARISNHENLVGPPTEI
jgi:hypothetical protein